MKAEPGSLSYLSHAAIDFDLAESHSQVRVVSHSKFTAPHTFFMFSFSSLLQSSSFLVPLGREINFLTALFLTEMHVYCILDGDHVFFILDCDLRY